MVDRTNRQVLVTVAAWLPMGCAQRVNDAPGSPSPRGLRGSAGPTDTGSCGVRGHGTESDVTSEVESSPEDATSRADRWAGHVGCSRYTPEDDDEQSNEAIGTRRPARAVGGEAARPDH